VLYHVSSLTENDVIQQDIPGKIKSGMDLSLEEKAEMRVEQGMEKKAEFSVEKSVEDAINQKYAASLVNAEKVKVAQDFQAVGNVIPPPEQVQASVGILPVPVPVPVQSMPAPVQEKKQLTPEQLRAFEIAAEMSVEKQAETSVEHAAEVSVDSNYFAAVEAGAESSVAHVHVPVVATPIQPVVPASVVVTPIQPVVPAAVVATPIQPVVVAAAVTEAVISPAIEEPLDEDRMEYIYKILQDRKTSKSVQKDAVAQTKDASMEPKERAFGILKNVGMVMMAVVSTIILYNQENLFDKVM